MLDLIIEDRLDRERDRFIDAIDEGAIIKLTRSYHNNDACHFFLPPKRGSFNICYFVRFPSDGPSWVVRVPLRPYLAFPAQRKIQREVATMEYVSQNTSIPIPRVIAHSLDDGAPGIGSFLILEYVDGEPLSNVGACTLSGAQRDRLFEHLASIHIQLRRLALPTMGALHRTLEGGLQAVAQGPISIAFNTQELEGLQPPCAFPLGVLSSANEYISMLLHTAQNTFEKSWAYISLEKNDGKRRLYYLDQFIRLASQWLDKSLDQGPFVLSHGDLSERNIIFDSQMQIIAVLDWEWSYVVPLQLFHPPMWLSSPNLELLASREGYDHSLHSLGKFRSVFGKRESALFWDTLLSDEWAKAQDDGGILVAVALESMDMDILYLFRCRYRDNLNFPEGLINNFMAQGQKRELLARKIRDREAYKAECLKLDELAGKPVGGSKAEKIAESRWTVLQQFSLGALDLGVLTALVVVMVRHRPIARTSLLTRLRYQALVGRLICCVRRSTGLIPVGLIGSVA